MKTSDLFEKLDILEELIKSEAQEYSPVFEKIKQVIDAASEDLNKSGPDDEDYDPWNVKEDEEDAGNDYEEGSDEGDEADKFLAGADGNGAKGPPGVKGPDGSPEEEPTGPKRRQSPEWKPREDYSPKEQAAIKTYIDQGYSHREAEKLANASQGRSDLEAGMRMNFRPNSSPKMWERIKQLTPHYIRNLDKHERLNAEATKNPMKFAAGKLNSAHEDKTKDYAEAWHEFTSNPGLKHLTPRERHAAAREWKQKWREGNQDYSKGLDIVSGEQRHFGEAADVRSKALQEKMDHILSGGASGGSMDAYEAAQHLGMSTSEEDAGPNVTTFQDPSAAFAHRNADFIEMLNQKKAAQEATRLPTKESVAAPPPPAAAPVTPAKPNPGFTVRKKASPEQLDRFNRVTAAKSAMINKPEGGEEE